MNIINQEVQNYSLLDLVYSMYSNRILNENLIKSQLYKNITVSGKNIEHTIDIYIEFVQMNNLERTLIKIIESNDVKKSDIYEFDNLLKDLGFFPKGIIYFNGKIDDEAVKYAKKRGIQVIKFDINKEIIEDIKKSIKTVLPNHEIIGDPFWILMKIDETNQENTGNYLISDNRVLLFTSIIDRDVKYYNLAIVELNERITRIVDEVGKLHDAIDNILTFVLDYNEMTEAQQYELGSYVNLMQSSIQLLINPIKELQPKYKEEDFEKFASLKGKKAEQEICDEHKVLLISLANFLYKIELDDKDKKLLWKSLKRNKKMLESLNISKKEFSIKVIDAVLEALRYKYKHG